MAPYQYISQLFGVDPSLVGSVELELTDPAQVLVGISHAQVLRCRASAKLRFELYSAEAPNTNVQGLGSIRITDWDVTYPDRSGAMGYHTSRIVAKLGKGPESSFLLGCFNSDYLQEP